MKKWTISIVFLSVFTMLISSGCEPLRKKFVRKKKEEKKEAFIPVLEPVDYKIQEKTPKEKYSYHFSLWRLWSKELIEYLEVKDKNDKRTGYFLSQIIAQLEEMKKYVKAEKRKALDVLLKQIKDVYTEFNNQMPVMNESIIKNKIKRNDKMIRNNFNPEVNDLFN